MLSPLSQRRRDEKIRLSLPSGRAAYLIVTVIFFETTGGLNG